MKRALDNHAEETMSSTNHPARRVGVSISVAMGLLIVMTTPSFAQQPASSDPETVTIASGIDFLNQYMFRGIRQNSTELAMWPSAGVGVRVFSGNSGIKSLGFNVDFWNSLHTGDTGLHGPSGKLWYESDVSTTFRIGFGRGVSVGTTYTAYRSPSNMFTSEKEIVFRVMVDDRSALGRGAIRPYALVAFEIAAKPGEGQADGGLHAGKYLEIGIAPGITVRRANIAAPVKLGLSLGDYYELAGKDNAFGFVSVAGVVTMPVCRSARFGAWSVHVGVEYQSLGKTTTVFNGGDGSKIIGTLGIGFSYK